MKNKIRISDMDTLLREKQRLQTLCESQESVLLNHVHELQQNYKSMALYSVLPFKPDTNNKVVKVLGMIGENVLPVVGLPFKGGGLVRMIQGLVIGQSFRMIRKLLAKRKGGSITRRK